MKNNLIIMFFPGLGGNHLANIISISKEYKNFKVDRSQYFNPSKKSNAHYNNANSISSNINTDNYIFLYHFGTADEDNIKKIIDTSTNYQFLVIGFPQKNQLAFKRMERKNEVDLRKYFIRYDLERLYKQQFLEKYYPGKWCTIFADDLFSNQNIEQFLTDLENKLEINILDRELAISIHNRWILNLEETLLKAKSNDHPN